MSKSKTRSTSTQQSTAVTTPSTPSWLEGPYKGLTGQIDQLAQNRAPVVAGPSALQQQTFARAGQAPVWRSVLDAAADMAGAVPTAPNTATATGYTAAGPAAVTGFDASGPAAVSGVTAAGPAATRGYQASGPASVSGYEAAGPAEAAGYTALGPAEAFGYTAAGRAGGEGYMAAGPAAVRDAQAGTVQAASLLDGFDRYLAPGFDNVVKTSLADYDFDAGRTRAEQAAQAAANGNFRGSRFAIREAATEEGLARGRGSLAANLYDQNFTRAATLSGQDADRRQGASTTNAQLQTQAALANADAANRSALDFAGRTDQAGAFGASERNRSALDFVGRSDEAASRLADARSRSALDFAGRSDQAASQFADARSRSALDYAGRSDQAASQFADARTRSAMDFVGRSDQSEAFGADSFNRSVLDFVGRQDRAGEFTADANNRSALDFTGRQDQAGMFGASERNRSLLDFAGRQDQAGQFGADAANRIGMFNAGQADVAADRGLRTAGLFGDLASLMGSNERADLGVLAQLGGQQRDIEQAKLLEEYQRLGLLGGLFDDVPIGAFTGQTTTSNGTASGTQTTNPGLLGSLSQIANIVGAGADAFSAFKMASDRRVKTDVAPVGPDDRGLNWYDYRYVWDEPDAPKRRGVMAQELIGTAYEHAVSRHPAGFLQVDYGALGA